jgi:hypothetical protein
MARAAGAEWKPWGEGRGTFQASSGASELNGSARICNVLDVHCSDAMHAFTIT